MGDRGNIKIMDDQDPTEGIYLYSHWQGASLPSILQKALAKNLRWDDPTYLARIIFEAMLEGNISAELGYGISTTYRDGNHATLVVSTTKQRIYLYNEDTKKYLSFGMYLKNFADGKWDTARFWKKYDQQEEGETPCTHSRRCLYCGR